MQWALRARKLRKPPSPRVAQLRYSNDVSFERSLKEGNLAQARAILDELANLPDTGGLYMPECYADLARAHDQRGEHDEAIATLECAIEHGLRGQPDPRSDIAEFHLRAGRSAEAAAIWAELEATEPDDVWLYNAAGLSYGEIGEHELAVAWLGEGLELAMRSDDPEGIAAQLSDLRRRSLDALSQPHDELEHRVEPFLEQWLAIRRERNQRFDLHAALEEVMPPTDAAPLGGADGDAAIAIAWFPAGEYERAIQRWAELAEEWADVAHPDYCRRLDGHIKWMRAQGVRIRAIAPILVDDYSAWCEATDTYPEEGRARYAAHLLLEGDVIPWPPGRNEACWCGSLRKYKKCCGPAPPKPMTKA